MPYKWTVMVYMAGDNNLDSNGVSDLQEMKRVGSTNQIAIIAQFDRKGNQSHTKRYHLRKYSQSPNIKNDEVDDLGETNSGSAQEFTRFIQWGMTNYKAEHYLVIIWGHGAGAYDEDIYYADTRTLRRNLKRHGVFRPYFGPAVTPGATALLESGLIGPLPDELRLIAPDDDAKDFLDNVELKTALNAVGQQIDILGMDACLMSMAEVCYQVRESVGITVASEAEEDLEGWPYERFLAKLVAHPTFSARQLATVIVEEFAGLYSEYESANATLAACNLSELNGVTESVDGLALSLLANLSNSKILDAIMLSRCRAWSDEIVDSVDLYDFCELLQVRCGNADIALACTKTMEAIEEPRFVLKKEMVGTDVAHSHGVGIYFPRDEVSPLYQNLDFVQPNITNWGRFLTKYVELTHR